MKQSEFKFRINAYSPTTMPMERLAIYLTELSKVLGEQAHVHLVGIEEGSTVPLLKIDEEAVPRVKDRINSCVTGYAASELMKTYERVNSLLREDNADACLEEEGEKIIFFPGVKEELPKVISHIQQQGEIDGIINRIIGTAEKVVRVGLEIDGVQVSKCETTKHIAKVLGAYLFEPVRLSGTGWWNRDSKGIWQLEKFKIDNFEVLSNESLSNIAAELRKKHKSAFTEDTFNELLHLRKDA